MDFLEHTLDVLADNGKTVEDIVWIGTGDIEISWDEFNLMAEDEENVDAGNMGLVAIPADLKIVGDKWWLDLESFPSIEDDEQIEWVYREKPIRPFMSRKERVEVHDSLLSSDIKDFTIIFGDQQLENSEVIFIEPFESYSQ